MVLYILTFRLFHVIDINNMADVKHVILYSDFRRIGVS
jgi:hypothetical protein